MHYCISRGCPKCRYRVGLQCFPEKAAATWAPSCSYCTVQMHEVVITLGKICLVRSRLCCIQQMHPAMLLYEQS